MKTTRTYNTTCTFSLFNNSRKPFYLFFILLVCSSGILLGQDYSTTGISDKWEDPAAWTCIGGGCNQNPYPNNTISNSEITINHNIFYNSNNPIKINRNGHLRIFENALLTTISNINVNTGGKLTVLQGQINIGPGILNNDGQINLTNAILTKNGNVVNNASITLQNACVNLTEGNFLNKNSLLGVGSIKALNGNINNSGTWSADVLYYTSRNSSGIPINPSTLDEVDEVCACVLVNCDILPGYPTNSKVNELIGSALTSLATNYDPEQPTQPVNELIYTLNGNGDVLIEIVVNSGQYNGVVSLLGPYNVFPSDFISDVYNPMDDERVITVFFPIIHLSELNPNTNLINQVYEVSRPIPNTGLIPSQGDVAQNSNIARLGWKLSGKDIKIGIIT
jgi:hypothetical protein